jgi:hypothetical protein
LTPFEKHAFFSDLKHYVARPAMSLAYGSRERFQEIHFAASYYLVSHPSSAHEVWRLTGDGRPCPNSGSLDAGFSLAVSKNQENKFREPTNSGRENWQPFFEQIKPYPAEAVPVHWAAISPRTSPLHH